MTEVPWGSLFGLMFMTMGPVRAVAVYSRVGDSDEAPGVRALATRSAALVAAAFLLTVLVGDSVLSAWGVSIPALIAAGGLVLIALSTQALLLPSAGPPSAIDPERTPAAAIAFRRRRWRWRMCARCGSTTPTARRRCGGYARAPRRSGRRFAPNAEAHARDLASVVGDVRAGGATSLQAISAELNDRGILTPERGLARLDGSQPHPTAGPAEGGMRQLRLMSLVEAVANLVVGYGLAVLPRAAVDRYSGTPARARPSTKTSQCAKFARLSRISERRRGGVMASRIAMNSRASSTSPRWPQQQIRLFRWPP
jgi:hypothetical protein